MAIKLVDKRANIKLTTENKGNVDLTTPSMNTYPIYDGDYVVIPKAEELQELDTQGTVLQDNVVVEKIPYAKVSNYAGGNTVVIA